jgi:chromosome segregation ATPase
LAAGESRCRDILEEARKVFGDLEGRFETLFDEGEKALLQAQQEMANLQARWQQAREALEEDIRRIKQELGREALDPEILIRLTEERERLEPRRRGFLQIEAELQQLRDKRASLLEELQDARRKAWELRRQQAEAINDRLERRVRIEVIYMGNREIFAERLTELLRGSGVDRESIQRMRAAEDLNGYAIAQAVRQGTDDLQKYGLTSRRAQQVREFLLRNEDRLLEMELLVPEDAVRVYLKMLGDGEQPLEKLSAHIGFEVKWRN